VAGEKGARGRTVAPASEIRDGVNKRLESCEQQTVVLAVSSVHLKEDKKRKRSGTELDGMDGKDDHGPRYGSEGKAGEE
jgi:hypothetical protein